MKMFLFRNILEKEMKKFSTQFFSLLFFLITLFITINAYSKSKLGLNRRQILISSYYGSLSSSFGVEILPPPFTQNRKKKPGPNKLAKWRYQIDKIDYQIIKNIADRMIISKKIGEYKRNNNLAVVQPNRWNEVVQDRKTFAEKLELDSNFIKKLLNLIHDESVRKQMELR